MARKPISLDKSEYTVHEIAQLGRVTEKTVHRWVRTGVLPPAPFRGRSTRYALEHARRARAIALAGVQVVRLPSFVEMVPIILGEKPATAAPPPAAPTSVGPSTWTRTVLAPGLELHLAAHATPEVVRLAVKLEGAAQIA